MSDKQPQHPDEVAPWSSQEIRREAIAGLTTFRTMSYVVVVNPAILAKSGLAIEPLLTATVLTAAVSSILMGLWARLPYALAPGMGLNAFFTYELVIDRQVPPEQALGLVVWSGILFLCLSATPLRRMIARAIPVHLRDAVGGGIGIFLAFIGLQKSGLIVAHSDVLVKLGELTPSSVLFLVGLLMAAALYRAGRSYAFLAAIGTVTVLGFFVDGGTSPPKTLVAWPDFSLMFEADLAGSFQLALLPPLLTLFFTDLFDSLSTFLGVSQAAGLVDEEGEPIRIEQALAVDAVATFTAGLAGSSAATTYVESTSGIEVGGRTGLTAVVAGLLFLPCLFLSPLVGIIPDFATGPILLILGALMLRATGGMSTRPLEERLPAFVVMILIPLSYSITNGILCGFILHPLLFLLAGRGRELPLMMWALSLVAWGLLILEQVG